MSSSPTTPPADTDLGELIHRADLDGLVRLIDAHCSTAQWAALLELRDRTRSAVTTGRQLWPAATLAEYRLALWAPAQWAARVLEEDSGRFTIGPLTEVIAQRHTFAELAEYLPPGPRLGFVANERAIRGESIEKITLERLGAPDVLEIPLTLQSWEPQYRLAVYTDEGVTAHPPTAPPAAAFRQARIRRDHGTVDDQAVYRATRQMLEGWTASSDGKAEITCVEGDAAAAVRALGVRHARLAPLEAREALAWLGWAGASGGAHGRRRGAAIGRFSAWWLVAAMADALDDWPLPPDEIGEIAEELVWWWWDGGEPSLGWELQIAVEDPAEGYSRAISAHDAA
ncbi:MAG: DUF6183 family protein [Ilumatobacteraceae bacterium]